MRGELDSSFSLYRYGNVLDNIFQHLIRLLGLLQRRSVEAVYDHAVGEDGHDERLEIFRSAEGAAFEKSHGLRGAV